MEFTRLFDILPYQLKNFPQSDALCYKEEESGTRQWRKFSTAECIDRVNEVSRALIAYGIQPGDKIAIISNNRPEWDFVDLGMMQIGAINVPVYPTISESEYKFIFNDAEVKMIFVSDAELFQKVKNIQPALPNLKEIYSFEKIPGAAHWSELLSKGKTVSMNLVEARMNAIKPEDLATIIYTSGTTGTPKGVMLSHKNVIANVRQVLPVLPINHTHRTLSFLPKCHIFERMVTYTYLSVGASIYYAESMETIGENLKEVKPHYFTTVPRLLEKVYDKIVGKGMELKGIKKKLFFWALNLGLKYDPDKNQGLWYDIQLNLANKIIFSKWREALGGEIEGIVTGAAALQQRLSRVFNAARIPVREGYGQTEASPVVSFNRFEKGGWKIGSIGLPVPGIEMKLGAQNEILARGENIMMGYYKRPDLTEQAIDKEGWLHTGDVGEKMDDKFIKITDRIKELFKTSGGKYVAPQVIENKMKESPFIEQMMVIGENQKFVAALIVPAFLQLNDWCAKNGINSDSKETILKLPEVQKLFREELDHLSKDFGHVEQVKKFELIPDEWTPLSGELTPTMKVKRKVVTEKYQRLIEKIYS